MMLAPLLLALILPCIGMTTVFAIYILLVWCSSTTDHVTGSGQVDVGKPSGNGLTDSELKKLSCSVERRELKETECVVCLENLEMGQLVRLLPDCHHEFHLECADAWLSKNSACPICRHKLEIPPEPGDKEDEEILCPSNLI